MILSFFLLFILIRSSTNNQGIITSLCYTISLWTIVLFTITEVMSVFSFISKLHLLVFWGCFILVLLITILWLMRRKQISTDVLFLDIKNIADKVCKEHLYILFIIVFIAAFVLAMMTVPYNYDSMCYHLSRIAHWAQNGSVAHYTTNDVRQLTSPVLAEFVNLHVYIIYGFLNDSVLNLLQFFSYTINAMLIYGICRRLGIPEKGRIIGVFLFVSMPIAFSEALSTQVDEYSTMWLLIFVYFMLSYAGKSFTVNFRCLFDILTIGFSLGFSYLAKPSVIMAEAVFALWVLLIHIKQKKEVKLSCIYAVAALLISAVIISPEIHRNIDTFGEISAPQAGERQLVGTLRPNYLIINSMKNIADNMTNIYFYDGGKALSKIVYKSASLLNVDANDPSIAEDGLEYEIKEAQKYNHDSAGNPVIVILFIVFLFRFILCRKRNKADKTNEGYFIAAAASFIIFTFVVRWEPYVSRYMLGYLAILCPAIASQLCTIRIKREELFKQIYAIIVFVCTVDIYGLSVFHAEICYTQKSNDRRSDGYYVYNPDIKNSYNSALDYLIQNNCTFLGISIGSSIFEYPIWAAMRNDAEIESVVDSYNVTYKYDNADFIPSYILAVGENEEKILYHDEEYVLEETFDNTTSIYKLVTVG